MNQMLRIAGRNISRQKKRNAMLAGAIGFGFLVITLVNGFTSGLIKTVGGNFSHAFGGHLYFSGTVISEKGTETARIVDPAPVEAALESLGDRVESVHRRSIASGTLVFGSMEARQKLEGLDIDDEKGFRTNLLVLEGSLELMSQAGALVLPRETAEKLGVRVGESLIFKATTVTGQQNVADFVLIATTQGQSTFGMNSGYANQRDINRLISLAEGEFQTINVYLRDIADIDSAAAAAYASLSGLATLEPRTEKTGIADMPKNLMKNMMGSGSQKHIKEADRWTGTKLKLSTLNELMSTVLSLVSVLKAIGFGVFVTLLLITMVGILNSYRMVMIERTVEIGTMRALGVQKTGIRDIFMFESLVIAAIGSIAGWLGAMALMSILRLFDLQGNQMLSIFLTQGRLRFDVSILDSLKNMLLIGVMSLAAVYLPAKKASEMKPADALRTSY